MLNDNFQEIYFAEFYFIIAFVIFLMVKNFIGEFISVLKKNYFIFKLNKTTSFITCRCLAIDFSS
jgi:hypothetical protein